MGYRLAKVGPELNHLLFMNDQVKLFARSEKEVDSLVQTVRICSEDIGMEMGISKYAVVTMHKGNRVKATGIQLPNGGRLHDPDESGYKYLGILELDDILVTEMKEKVQNAYFEVQ